MFPLIHATFQQTVSDFPMDILDSSEMRTSEYICIASVVYYVEGDDDAEI